MTEQWNKITAQRVGDLVDADELDPESRTLFDPEKRPETLVHDLAEAGKWPDAVKVAARALPPREAVWWACMCGREMKSLVENEKEMAALKAAELWVFKPGDESRKHAFQKAQDSDEKSVGSLAAFAATFNEGKLPLVDGSEVDLDGSVFANLILGAVMVSAGDVKPEEIYGQYERFLASAEDIANGGDGRMNQAED